MALQSLRSFVCSASCVSATLTEGKTSGSEQPVLNSEITCAGRVV